MEWEGNGTAILTVLLRVRGGATLEQGGQIFGQDRLVKNIEQAAAPILGAAALLAGATQAALLVHVPENA